MKGRSVYPLALALAACAMPAVPRQASAYVSEDEPRVALRFGVPVTGAGVGALEAFPNGQTENFDFEFDDVGGWFVDADVNLTPQLWAYGGFGDRTYDIELPATFYIQRTRDYHGGLRWSPVAGAMQPYVQLGGRTGEMRTISGTQFGFLSASSERQSALDLGLGARVQLFDFVSLDANVARSFVFEEASSILGERRVVEGWVFSVSAGITF